jgi:transposase-like protein
VTVSKEEITMFRSTDAKLMMQQVDMLVARGKSIAMATSEVGVTQAAYAHWLREHNGAVPVSVDRLSHLQDENVRLRRTLAKMSMELDAMRHLQADVFDQPLAA